MKTQNQKELAEFLEISPQYVSDIKNKRRSLGKKSALRISRKTGIPTGDLIFLNGADFMNRVQLAMLEACK